jgi:TRAP-type C4-dicarboxylate transport system permease small subunit
MMQFIKKIDDIIATVERFFLTLFTAALVLILTAQVILRYVFSRPLFWAEEISLQFLVFSTLIGMSLFLTATLSESVNRKIMILVQVLGLTAILVFAYHGTLWLLRPEVRMEISPTIGTPIWINYAMFPLTFYCMAYHLAAGLMTALFPGNKVEERSC